MGTLRRNGQVEVFTDATPEQVWELVADVTGIGKWSHECQAASWLDGATEARPGARFRGTNRVGSVRWSRVSEVVTVDAPHELVWRTIPSPLHNDSTEWRIRIDSVDGRTRIVQSFEVLKLGPLMDRFIYLTTPAHRDRLPALQADLERLGDAARAAVQPMAPARRSTPSP